MGPPTDPADGGNVARMPSFDVVSEVDDQEVRNAVDQASREIANRYDFKGTDSSIELGDGEIKTAHVRPRTGSTPCGTCSRRSWSGARCR